MAVSSENLIIALDYPNKNKAIELVNELSDQVTWYKVGPVLFSSGGPDIIEYLLSKNKKIFLDLKLHDIPNIVAKTICEIGEMGVHLATVHCLGGREMLKAASEACRGLDLKLLGVTLLTSHDRGEMASWGWQGTSQDWIEKLLDMAVDSRLHGVVCSPHEAKQVKSYVNRDGFLVVTPGIRLNEESVYEDDQKRIATPEKALEEGSDFLVVGRPVTQAREPKDIVTQLLRN